jgi:hypothetical protein
MVSTPQGHKLPSVFKEVGPKHYSLRIILERESLKGVDVLYPTELGDL